MRGEVLLYVYGRRMGHGIARHSMGGLQTPPQISARSAMEASVYRT